MKNVNINVLKNAAKILIDDGKNEEYTRGICELVANVDGIEGLPSDIRAQQIHRFFLPDGVWICTDPDNDQWRLNEGQDIWKDTKFRFKQENECLDIDLKDYTLAEINGIISSFGYIGNGAVYYINGEDTEIDNSIIAECIFESEIGVV